MLSIPGTMTPGDLGLAVLGLLSCTATKLLGWDLLGKLLGPSRASWRRGGGVKVVCGTFTRLCQAQQDRARALSSAQHLQEGSQPTQEQDLVPLAGLQFHLGGHGVDLQLSGLQNHGDPGWVFGFHLW